MLMNPYTNFFGILAEYKSGILMTTFSMICQNITFIQDSGWQFQPVEVLIVFPFLTWYNITVFSLTLYTLSYIDSQYSFMVLL
jgi:hypothetical protein